MVAEMLDTLKAHVLDDIGEGYCDETPLDRDDLLGFIEVSIEAYMDSQFDAQIEKQIKGGK